MQFFTAVEIFTQIITYVMILSGIPPCIACVRTKNTHKAPWAFILVGFCNAILTTVYGVMIKQTPIVQMNAIATLVNIAYIMAYVYASREKMKPIRQVASSITVLLVVYLVIYNFIAPSRRHDTLGMVLFCLTTLLLVTPLVQFKQCLDEQSASCLSMSMLVAGTLCCSAWACYGYLLNNFYIYAPNVVGLVPNLCQWFALVRFRNSSTKAGHHE